LLKGRAYSKCIMTASPCWFLLLCLHVEDLQLVALGDVGRTATAVQQHLLRPAPSPNTVMQQQHHLSKMSHICVLCVAADMRRLPTSQSSLWAMAWFGSSSSRCYPMRM
jgi:hypothetical protein